MRALSRSGDSEPRLQALRFAQQWTGTIDWNSLERARKGLDACRAFLVPDNAEGRILRLPGR